MSEKVRIRRVGTSETVWSGDSERGAEEFLRTIAPNGTYEVWTSHSANDLVCWVVRQDDRGDRIVHR